MLLFERIGEMPIYVINEDIVNQRRLKMKIKIGAKEIMILQLIMEIVKALYTKVPSAKLIHADLEWSERKYDSLNWNGHTIVKFSVSVTPAIKVDLLAHVHFVKSDWEYSTEKGWYPNLISVSHPKSRVSIELGVTKNGIVPCGQHDSFLQMIGNPTTFPQG